MTRTLDAAAYWKLRALCTDAQRCNDALAAAAKRQAGALADLGLPADAQNFTLNDDTCEVTFPDDVKGAP